LDVLPHGSVAWAERYYLYRGDRPQSALLRRGDTIEFGSGGSERSHLGPGWSKPERSQRWTEGPSATLVLPMAQTTAPLWLQFEVAAHNCVETAVRVNGEPRTKWTFSKCGVHEARTVEIRPEDLQRGAGVVTLTFEMSGVKSPAQVNPAVSDARLLGLSVRRIVVTGAASAEAK
jgi:hypothetical protein